MRRPSRPHALLLVSIVYSLASPSRTPRLPGFSYQQTIMGITSDPTDFLQENRTPGRLFSHGTVLRTVKVTLLQVGHAHRFWFQSVRRRCVLPTTLLFGLVGHTGVRMYVMGDDGYERAATEDEIQRMSEVVRESMRAGAVGFSTSRGPAHIGYLGPPVPSRKGPKWRN